MGSLFELNLHAAFTMTALSARFPADTTAESILLRVTLEVASTTSAFGKFLSEKLDKLSVG